MWMLKLYVLWENGMFHQWSATDKSVRKSGTNMSVTLGLIELKRLNQLINGKWHSRAWNNIRKNEVDNFVVNFFKFSNYFFTGYKFVYF